MPAPEEILGKAVVEGVEKLVPKAESLFWNIIRNNTQSVEHVFGQSEAGRWLSPFLPRIEQAADQAATRMTDGHLKLYGNQPVKIAGRKGYTFDEHAREYKKEAFADTTKAAFGGKKLPTLTAAIVQAHEEKGYLYADTMKNHLDQWMKGSNSAWQQAKELKKLGFSGKSDYTSAGVSAVAKLEPIMNAALRKILLGKVVIPHATQYFVNSLVNSTPVHIIGHSIADLFDEKALEAIHNSGAMFQDMLHGYQNKAENKGFWKLLPTMPGMTTVRKFGVLSSAAQGSRLGEYASEKLMSEDEHIAKQGAAWLKELGLDPEVVKARKGQRFGEKNSLLLPDEIDRAMYNRVDTIMNRRNPLKTPGYWERNWATRQMWAYKNFGFRQGMLVANSLKTMYAKEGAKGVFQTMVTLGTIFPAVGEMNHRAYNFVRGRGFTNPDKDNPLMKLAGNDPTGKLVARYIDDWAMLGGFAIGYSLVRDGLDHRLSGAFAGPAAGIAEQVGQDATDIGKSLFNKKRGSTKTALKKTVKHVSNYAGVGGQLLSEKLDYLKKQYNNLIHFQGETK